MYFFASVPFKAQDGYNQMSDAVSVCVLAFILVCYTVANRFGADLNKSM
jgi:hypothetical protein